jgi:hypothetical protein
MLLRCESDHALGRSEPHNLRRLQPARDLAGAAYRRTFLDMLRSEPSDLSPAGVPDETMRRSTTALGEMETSYDLFGTPDHVRRTARRSATCASSRATTRTTRWRSRPCPSTTTSSGRRSPVDPLVRLRRNSPARPVRPRPAHRRRLGKRRFLRPGLVHPRRESRRLRRRDVPQRQAAEDDAVHHAVVAARWRLRRPPN